MLILSEGTYRVRLAACGRVRCEPGWSLAPDWAPRLRDYDLWFVWSGRGRMITSDGEVELRPGVVFWMRPGRRYEAQQDPEARLGVNFLHFTLADAGGRPLPKSWKPPVEVMNTRRLELTDAALRRVIELVSRRTTDPAGESVAEGWFGAVLGDLVREQREEVEPNVAGLTRRHRDIVERAVERIRERPGEVPGVAALAREAGYSVDHFARLFARWTGLSPQEYLINARMERARSLLAETELSVGMIAEALGFRDLFFFSRQFRQRVGVSPTAYRRGWLDHGAAPVARPGES